MRLTYEEIKNKFSALDFDKQNARQNRIYSKLSFKTDDRRYAMKKFIYALGTVCVIGLLLIPVFKKEKKIEQPEIKKPVTTVAEKPEIKKEEVKTPVFVKGEKDGLPTTGLEETERNPFLSQGEIETERKKAETMRREAAKLERNVWAEAAYDGAAMANFSAKAGSAGLAYEKGRSMRMMPPPPDYRRHYSYSADYDSMNAESFKSFEGNTFKFVSQEPLSTFSADVDTASYNIVRRDIERGKLPNKDAVRTEEFINYFTYDYPAPKSSSKDPVNIITELTDSPWTEDLQVVKIGVKAKDIDKDKLPASNLVFLVDVSGSMSGNTRLPLVKKSFAMLVEKLRPQDKVSIVTYANGTSVVLDGASLKEEGGKQKILSAMESLRAGGGTNGSAGLSTAYEVAKKNFIKGGNNRIILATDGDFNIGNTSLGGLEKQITDAKESGVFLSVLGFGMGNYKDDKVQTLANKGNGNYAYINDLFEAKKALVKDFGATLFTVAKDVKFQVEFNPARVQAYRLIGYEKRKLNDQDFNDDTKDAGELGAGHTVTVIYEIVPTGVKMPDGMAGIDELKYSVKETAKTVESDELLTVKLRYKEPDGDKSKLLSKVLKAKDYVAFDKTSDDTRFALSAAAFAELLKGGRYSQETDINKLIKEARKAKGEDEDGYRADFVKIMSLYESLPKESERVGNVQKGNHIRTIETGMVRISEAARQASNKHYRYGLAAFSEGNYAKAKEEWLLALNLDPTNNDAALGLKRVEEKIQINSCTKTVTVPSSAQAADISYKQAKADFDRLAEIVDKLAASAERYYKSHNRLPESLNDLDTCFTGNVTFEYNRQGQFHYKYFDGFPDRGQNLLLGAKGSYYATNQHNSYGVISPNAQSASAGKHFCKALITDDVANQVCQKVSGKRNPDSTNIDYSPSSYGILANTFHETGPAKVIATYNW